MLILSRSVFFFHFEGHLNLFWVYVIELLWENFLASPTLDCLHGQWLCPCKVLMMQICESGFVKNRQNSEIDIKNFNVFSFGTVLMYMHSKPLFEV